MTTAVFDTRKAVRRLTDAGVAEAQADAMVDTVAEAFSDTVATKADLANLELRLTRQLYGVAVGIVALTVTLVKLL